VIPAYNDAEHLRTCLAGLRTSAFQDFECIVVDDGSADDTSKVAWEFQATLLRTEDRKGPATARNTGAAFANGEILLFIDSDVCVHPDTLQRVAEAFTQDPELDALIGAYDDDPASPDFISKYRNLMHCYVHRHGDRKASTFWGACGAIRRTVFEEAKGFDESYTQPSGEDIELGYRLSGLHKKVILDPDVLVKHMKKWTFGGLIRTDVSCRGIPWTELILRYRKMPDDLNLKFSQRISVLLAFLSVMLAALAIVDSWGIYGFNLFRILEHPAAYGFYATTVILILLNAEFYLFLASRMGGSRALAAIPLHLLFFLYSGVASILGVLKYLVRRRSIASSHLVL